MFDDIHYEHEETFSKVRVELEVVLNNFKSWGTQAIVYNWQLIM